MLTPRVLQETKVRALFDRKAEQWSDKYNGFFRHRVSLFLSELRNRVPVGSRILDFGCGSGVYLEAMAKEGYRTVGVDLSDVMIAQARERCQQAGCDVEFYVGSLRETADKLGFFEGMIGSSLFEYLSDPRLNLRTMRSLLRPNGIVLLTVPNYDSRRKQWERKIQRWRWCLNLAKWIPRVKGFLQYLELSRNHYRPEEFSELVTASGFEVVEWKFFNPLDGQCTDCDSLSGEMLFFVLQRPADVH